MQRWLCKFFSWKRIISSTKIMYNRLNSIRKRCTVLKLSLRTATQRLIRISIRRHNNFRPEDIFIIVFAVHFILKKKHILLYLKLSSLYLYSTANISLSFWSRLPAKSSLMYFRNLAASAAAAKCTGTPSPPWPSWRRGLKK